MHPDLVLGVPFLHRFTHLINWQERSFRIHRRDGTHWIPIVQKRPCRSAASVAFPHDPTPVTATGRIPFTEPTEEDKRAVAKMYDATQEDTRFSKSPTATAGGRETRTKEEEKGTTTRSRRTDTLR